MTKKFFRNLRDISIFCLLLLFLFSVKLYAAQPSEKLQVLGFWADTPCRTVLVDSSIAYFGADGYFEIVDFHDPANPVELGRLALPDTISGITIQDSLAFLGTRRGKVLIVDISDLHNMRLLGEYHSPLGTIKVNPVKGIMIHGNLAYAAYIGGRLPGVEGFIILDISNLASPRELKILYLQGMLQFEFAYPLVYFTRMDYLHAYDFSNDPLDPQIIGTYTIPAVRVPLALEIHDSTAYFLNNNWLDEIDISDPSNMIQKATHKLFFARDIAVRENRAYLLGSLELFAYDISQPDTAIQLGMYTYSGKSGETVRLAVEDSVAYVAASNSGLSLLDLSEPLNLHEIGSFNRLLEFTVIIPYKNVIFAGFATGGLWMMDFTDMEKPRVLAEYAAIERTEDMVRRDSLLYVADWHQGLRILDISNPLSVHEVGFLPLPGYYENIVLSGNYVYMTTRNEGVIVIDVSNPAAPQQVRFVFQPNAVEGLALQGQSLFVPLHHEGLLVLDISHPEQPVEVGHLEFPQWNPRDIAVQGDFAYIAAAHEGLKIIDISDPTAPRLRGSYSDRNGYFYYQVAVNGDFVYAGAGFRTLVFKVTSKLWPQLVATYDPNRGVQNLAVYGDTLYISQTGVLDILKNDLVTTAVATTVTPPANFALWPNFPNPFNPETRLQFDLPVAGHVVVAVYNIAGQRVRTLADGFFAPGTHRLLWNGRDSAGRPLASGIYLARLQAGDFVQVRKMSLLR